MNPSSAVARRLDHDSFSVVSDHGIPEYIIIPNNSHRDLYDVDDDEDEDHEGFCRTDTERNYPKPRDSSLTRSNTLLDCAPRLPHRRSSAQTVQISTQSLQELETLYQTKAATTRNNRYLSPPRNDLLPLKPTRNQSVDHDSHHTEKTDQEPTLPSNQACSGAMIQPTHSRPCPPRRKALRPAYVTSTLFCEKDASLPAGEPKKTQDRREKIPRRQTRDMDNPLQILQSAKTIFMDQLDEGGRIDDEDNCLPSVEQARSASRYSGDSNWNVDDDDDDDMEDEDLALALLPFLTQSQLVDAVYAGSSTATQAAQRASHRTGSRNSTLAEVDDDENDDDDRHRALPIAAEQSHSMPTSPKCCDLSNLKEPLDWATSQRRPTSRRSLPNVLIRRGSLVNSRGMNIDTKSFLCHSLEPETEAASTSQETAARWRRLSLQTPPSTRSTQSSKSFLSQAASIASSSAPALKAFLAPCARH